MRYDVSSLSMEDVTHEWSGRRGVRSVLRGVTLRAEAGGTVILSGASGAGKTTLLSVLGTLTRPTEGRVFVGSTYAWGLADAELSAIRNESIAFVFQRAELIGGLSLADNVGLPLVLRGAERAKVDAAVDRALSAVGLLDHAAALPRELSGGERRRAAFARAVASGARFVLADEPTADLDDATAGLVIDALRDLASRGCGIVVATHDPRLSAVGDLRYELHDGRVERV